MTVAYTRVGRSIPDLPRPAPATFVPGSRSIGSDQPLRGVRGHAPCKPRVGTRAATEGVMGSTRATTIAIATVLVAGCPDHRPPLNAEVREPGTDYEMVSTRLQPVPLQTAAPVAFDLDGVGSRTDDVLGGLLSSLPR